MMIYNFTCWLSLQLVEAFHWLSTCIFMWYDWNADRFNDVMNVLMEPRHRCSWIHLDSVAPWALPFYRCYCHWFGGGSLYMVASELNMPLVYNGCGRGFCYFPHLFYLLTYSLSFSLPVSFAPPSFTWGHIPPPPLHSDEWCVLCYYWKDASKRILYSLYFTGALINAPFKKYPIWSCLAYD